MPRAHPKRPLSQAIAHRVFAARRARWWGPAAAATLGVTGLRYAWRRRARRALPATDGRLALAGLSQPVEVIRDRWGVPHIYALTEADLFFAQGFVHAQDRLFQMDAHRRVGLGQISEMVGPAGLESDRFARIFGWARAAERQAGEVLRDPETAMAATAYRDGVNAFIAQGRLPVEYALLACRPRPWHVRDSSAWGAVLAWGLSVNWETELLRAMLIEQLGPEMADDLTPGYQDTYQTILPDSSVGSRLAAAMIQAYRQAMHYLPLDAVPAGSGVGSNNWVVNGQWTESGRPILANDPHLPPLFPTFWYENHLEGGRYCASGFTMAGLPGLIIGHNERIAWGITNAFPDVQDLYLERFDPADPTRYEVDGEWRAVELVEEHIHVRGRRPVVERVRYTHHGPIVSSLIPGEKRALALRWSCHDGANHLRAILETCLASDWTGFRRALRHWGFPSQNVVFAATDGDIGYMMPGLVPTRRHGAGLVPVPGWTSDYDWTGWIPFEELPALHNPAEGLIVTANNCIAGDGYPHLLTSEWLSPLRATRIRQLLQVASQQTMADHARIQTDTVSLLARRFMTQALPLLESRRPGSPHLDLLRGWDGDMSAGSPAPSLYFGLFVNLVEATFRQAVGPLADVLLGVGRRSEFPSNPFHEMAGELVCRWLEHGAPDWIGDPRPLLPAAYDRAVLTLRRRFGPHPEDWPWGRLHRIELRHPLARLPGLGRLWKPRILPVGGDGYSVSQTEVTPHFPPRPVHIIASCRLIMDVGDWDHSLAVLPGGQSGHFSSPHYQDGLQDWLAGRYHPMLFSREKVLQAAVGRLQLVPA